MPTFLAGYTVGTQGPCQISGITEGRFVTAPYGVPKGLEGKNLLLHEGTVRPMAATLGLVEEGPLLEQIAALQAEIEQVKSELADQNAELAASRYFMQRYHTATAHEDKTDFERQIAELDAKNQSQRTMIASLTGKTKKVEATDD